MKKGIILILVIVTIVIAIFSYYYFVYQRNYKIALQENRQYDSYYQQQISGTDLASLVNKAIDDNTKNEVTKDHKGKYVENTTNSVRIDIKFTDDDSIHTMEEIYQGGINTFVQYYSQIKFQCTKVGYHQSTHKVKYLFFEQITG